MVEDNLAYMLVLKARPQQRLLFDTFDRPGFAHQLWDASTIEFFNPPSIFGSQWRLRALRTENLMATTKQNVTLRVVNDGIVDLGGSKFLPKGDYPGWIETMHIAMRGETINQVGRVMLTLTEAQIAAALGVPPNPARLGMDMEVGSYFGAGQIRQV